MRASNVAQLVPDRIHESERRGSERGPPPNELGSRAATPFAPRTPQSTLKSIEPGHNRREAFRRNVLERLAAHAIRTSGAGHDINNSCASVTANLSYLALRADDLAGQAGRIPDPAVRSQLEAISTDIKEVTTESSEAMQRIVEITKRLGQGETKASQKVEEVIELSELSRRAVRLVGQCATGVHVAFHGLPAQVRSYAHEMGELVLDLIVLTLEDGAAPGDGCPASVDVQTAREEQDGVPARSVLRVSRQGATGPAPRLDGELARLVDVARKNRGEVAVSTPSPGGYVITIRFEAAGDY